ncbi:hypothetical protein EC973_005521 [Apophysomyces ossiformis]|uniref:Uncharacterized protein n=1 Tax=Apophysomyces ossiformis TaxID=679940 RepID=A0A8H7BKA2_9FUNG|nr:hypothetical protein EC973_005521 [Apophysomyces ossiformis]
MSLQRHHVQPERLTYKQTIVFEKTLAQLQRVMDLFQQVLEEWKQLQIKAEKHLAKHFTLAPSYRAAPLSTESLIQVASIQAESVQDSIANLCFMHCQDYQYKRTLLTTLPDHCKSAQDLDRLTDRWQDQIHIKRTVRDDIVERLKLYNTVKKVLESKD